MKRVLHLTNYLDIGGLERMILLLAQEQKRAGWGPHVFVYERDTGDLLPQFKSANIPVKFSAKGAGFSFRLPFRLLAHMRAEKIDILHTHDLGALIYGALVKLLSGHRIRLIHTQHSFQHLRSAKARLYEKIFPWLADRVVCVSEDLRRTYLGLGQPFERLRIIPNGVDFHTSLPGAKERLAAKTRLISIHNLSPALVDKKWIITLGRIAPIKGPEHSLSVWNAVEATAAKGAALLMVGPALEPGILDRLRSRAKKEIHFPGPSLDPQVWLAAADLFLSGSEFEGLPMAGLEAAAAGLPMLLSQIPGHALFQGWAAYFPLKEPERGARLIEAFLAGAELTPRADAVQALARLEAGCGATRMTERYLGIYRELLAPKD